MARTNRHKTGQKPKRRGLIGKTEPMPHERGNRHPVPRLQVVHDTETVFREAILAGVLSGIPGEPLYAEHYLYMFHDEDGVAWFKHRDTRAYLSMRPMRHAAGGGS